MSTDTNLFHVEFMINLFAPIVVLTALCVGDKPAHAAGVGLVHGIALFHPYCAKSSCNFLDPSTGIPVESLQVFHLKLGYPQRLGYLQHIADLGRHVPDDGPRGATPIQFNW